MAAAAAAVGGSEDKGRLQRELRAAVSMMTARSPHRWSRPAPPMKGTLMEVEAVAEVAVGAGGREAVERRAGAEAGATIVSELIA